MLRDIVNVHPLADWRLHVEFEDGVAGEIDLTELVPLEGVFAALRDQQEFRRVMVNRELGTIVWPTGADLDPDVIYARLTGQSVSSFANWRQSSSG